MANAGLTPYSLNTPLFSDYAEKFRLLYLPSGTKAKYRADEAFAFPVGATLVKTFAYPADMRVAGSPVELVDALPRGAVGKTDKQALRERLAAPGS